MITLLGARLADPYTGLAGGLAFSVIPAVQQYAQEGRSYALVAAGRGAGLPAAGRGDRRD
ncbi:hypothetical protein G3I76_50275 [Streptomyces sp. SID11233]|nr:hypothetical protein [Streptomyces sp. SID11233]